MINHYRLQPTSIYILLHLISPSELLLPPFPPYLRRRTSSSSSSSSSSTCTHSQSAVQHYFKSVLSNLSLYSFISIDQSKHKGKSHHILVIKMRSQAQTPCTTTTSTHSSWSISDDSLKRYVCFASENCIQELLSASESNGRATGNGNSSDNLGHDGGWNRVVSREINGGVEISKRRSGSLHIFRSRWLLRSVSPQQFMTVANAIDAAKQWDSDLVEAKYIKDLGNNLSIIRLKFGDAAKPLFKNREFIVYERRETLDDGTLVVAVASLPKEIAAGLHPKAKGNNAIRGLLLQSGWVVEKKVEDDSCCVVTYVVQLDPAGWLPKYFVNRFNTKLVMIIDNLRKLAQACPIN